MDKYLQLFGRIFLAHIFVMAGLSKISGYAGTQGYMESVGLPGMLLPLVILLEVGAGVAILVGWKTRIAALALAVFSIVSAVIFHSNLSDQMQMVMFMKNWSIAGGLLLLASYGAGAYSLEKTKVH